jgi:gamma-glutamyltranspeptidase/glutathione hydrolase
VTFRFAYGRPPAVAAEAMVATSQPLATRAGLRAFERGGNAADAALAAAAVLCVTEPMSTGIGGDAFAIVFSAAGCEGLDAAGPAPARADPLEPVEERGPRSVTVPGAVRGWQELASRHGRLGLDTCLADAIDAAERGFAVAARTAAAWSASSTSAGWAAAVVPPELSPPPRRGDRVVQRELAATLRAIAEHGPDAFYGGAVGEAICSASWLEEDDLTAYEAKWVEPLRLSYRGVDVLELPPPTQGVAALEALGLLEGHDAPELPAQIDSIRLALEDARAHVSDGADVSALLAPEYLARRRHEQSRFAREPAAGTVYLCAVDRDRNAVSWIQSLYGSFGSGLVAPGTGVVLQNRGACFATRGRVEPGRRPYHTIIPGMLVRDGALVGPFGVMGGFIQAQAHMQLVSGLVDDGLDPQAALDRARFWVDGPLVRLEEGLWPRAQELERLGYETVCDDDTFSFGGGQAILVEGDALFGGSDPRKDGYAAGL